MSKMSKLYIPKLQSKFISAGLIVFSALIYGTVFSLVISQGVVRAAEDKPSQDIPPSIIHNLLPSTDTNRDAPIYPILNDIPILTPEITPSPVIPEVPAQAPNNQPQTSATPLVTEEAQSPDLVVSSSQDQTSSTSDEVIAPPLSTSASATKDQTVASYNSSKLDQATTDRGHALAGIVGSLGVAMVSGSYMRRPEGGWYLSLVRGNN